MIKLYLTTLFYFLIIDTIGIQTFVVRIYNKNLPDNLKINLDITSAVIFYLIFVLGLVYFVVAPFKNASLTSLIVPAAMYGLATYATYALTVKAVFNVFNWTIVISDIAWGLAVDDASSIGLTVDRLEGSMDYEEALALWSEHTGFSTENYNYYRIFSLLKFSVIMVRVAKKLVFNNIMPLESDFYKNNYISNFLKSEFDANN